MIKKFSFLIFAMIYCGTVYTQDSNISWIESLDTTEYQIYFSKHRLNNSLYKVLDLNKRELAHKNQKVVWGCTVELPEKNQRFNWVAIKKDHWIISVSIGRRSLYSPIYFIRKEPNREYSIHILQIRGYKITDTFGFVARHIQTEEYDLEEW